MIETVAAVSADQAQQLTAAMWRHTQDQADGPLATAPRVRHIIDHAGGRAAQLQALVERVDALPTEQQRLFTAAVDEVQVRSKLWLIDELTSRVDLHGTTLAVLGAWYGVLPLLINWRLARPPARMVCLDVDAGACALGEQLIGPLYPNIEYQVGDAMTFDYAQLAATGSSVLVNTICEHLHDATGWWARVPAGQLSVLQSNNYDRCRDHVNCVHNLDEMNAQTPLSTLLFQGVLTLPIMDRFMLIGYR